MTIVIQNRQIDMRERSAGRPGRHRLMTWRGGYHGDTFGAMAVCDPYTEPSHYWGDIEPGLRAIDIWIGPPEWLGRGLGTQMMTRMIDRCFAEAGVTAVIIDPLNSTPAAQRFSRRLGFVEVGRRMFDQDDCLVMRLEKAAWSRRTA